ncbi:PaaI family thioesterase [Propionicicella superfundia]|uniref:PaaI family thioesterase n=1 Tax=Propionicicella superfundia TaxID=348582 RepID=UPI000407CA19|nr:PaaI family thioesterase [Propionicicella superfundia]
MSIPDFIADAVSHLDNRMGIVLEEVTPERTRGRMPVDGNTQVFGMLHGGASCVLIEGLASVAAVAEVGPGGRAFGVDINATHHRAVTSGWVHGEATAIYIGGRTATYEVVLTDDDGQRVCTGRLTCTLRRPGTHASGTSREPAPSPRHIQS